MKKLALMFIVLLVMCATQVVNIAWSSDRSGRGHQPGGLRKTDGSPVSTLININNLAGWIRNDGWSARNPSTGNAGVYFPRGTTTCIYQDGIVWGGNVNDGGSQVLRVGGQTYNIGTVGGRIISQGVAANPNAPDVRIYRIRRDYATADLKQDAAELLGKALSAVTDGDVATIRAQYQTDWNEWPGDQGAPYYDRNGNGRWDPGVDEPGIADADQVIWFVCNDLDPGKTNALYGSNPIGFELQETLWGYNRSDPLANVYFKKFTFIYKGTSTTPANANITDMYVCQWSDPDLGDSGDDFAGCDTTLSLAYAYNGHATDNLYSQFGLAPPAVGYDFFQGPKVRGAATDTAIFGLQKIPGFKNLPMTAAFYFAAGGRYSDPPFTRDGTIQWYNLLRGLTPVSGAPFIHPNVSGVTTYWLDGDPVKHTGRIDGVIDNPGDRRIGACSGPFTMALGDTQEIVVGVVAGIAGDYLTSVTIMKNNDVAAQKAYNSLFNLPKAPPSPIVSVGSLDKKIVLDWASDPAGVSATEGFNSNGYAFQGYNVYQLATSSTSVDLAADKRSLDTRSDVKILGTYDVVDGVRTIQDNTFDVTLNTDVQVIKQRGTDSGIKHQLILTNDAIHSTPLVNGQRYYYAVTAYGYSSDSTALTHALESPLQILTAIPSTPPPGVRYSSQVGDTIPYTRSGLSDGTVIATVVDPTKTTGHQYKVNFSKDTVNGGYFWGITDATINKVVEAQQKNQSGDDSYASVDGMVIKVLGPPEGMKSWEIPSGTRRFSPVGGFAGLGLEGFSNAGDPTAYDETAGTIGMGGHLAFGGIGSSLATTGYHTVLLKLAAVNHTSLWNPTAAPTDTNFSRAYRWLRSVPVGGQPADPSFAPWIINRGPGYVYQDYNYGVPFSAWDMETTPPTRLSVGMFENNVVGGLVDGRYWPPLTTGDNSVSREFCFIFSTPYSQTALPALQITNLQNKTVPLMWVMVCNRRADADWAAGDQFQIDANHINSETTEFDLTAPAAATVDATLARGDITQVNVFPNPYYGFNKAETVLNNHFVTFSHLPARAQIRIFNLAGVLVRAFDETDPNLRRFNGQFQNWDLNNQQGLPVASGLYIAYITMKDASGVDLGTKTLKLIVIQQQQYLQNF